MAVRALALAGAVLIGALGAVAATPKPEVSLAGAWRFETGSFNGDCRISGEMNITPKGPGAYGCTFYATQVCPGVKYVARQTCTVTQTGTDVVMTATIVDVKPATASYAPDDWVLKIVNPARMEGELRSADIAKAVFTRSEAAIS